jgi:hypothetical protein
MTDLSNVLLKPVTNKKEGVVLLDIEVDGEWCGSRRTYQACVRFISEKKEIEVTKVKPQSFRKMRQTYRTFGKKWWRQIHKEIERRECSE